MNQSSGYIVTYSKKESMISDYIDQQPALVTAGQLARMLQDSLVTVWQAAFVVLDDYRAEHEAGCYQDLTGITERLTERLTAIHGSPQRGARRKADIETRQYIHELRKYKNSLQAIANVTGMSKTQVYAILQEPEAAGRWYSGSGDSKTYYADYAAAIQSRKDIHFEPATATT